jgi:hypothetical protein
MKIIISRQLTNGSWPTVGTSDRVLFSGVVTESAAIDRATKYAQGRAFRIEFFHDERFYNELPFRTIEQSAFPGFQRQIYRQGAR